jgi:hypothetical protein
MSLSRNVQDTPEHAERVSFGATAQIGHNDVAEKAEAVA